MASKLQIAIAQLNFLVGDFEGNTDKIIQAAKYACDDMQANIIVFTELSITGYPLEDLLFHPSVFRRVENCIKRILTEVKGIYLVVGVPFKEKSELYNSALVIHNSKIVATYHKHRLPNYKVFDEKRYFKAGNKSCVINIENINIGISICEDIWYPNPIENSVKEGAELLINLNASPYQLDKHTDRMQVLQIRTKEQEIPIVYANQVGGQDELVFDGESLCVNKQGELVLRAPAFEEGIFKAIYSKEDKDILKSTCLHKALPKLASIYKAIVLGVKDYVTKNNFECVLLGLSGGIDSALTLAIAVDALGADRVHAIMMPFHYTSSMSIEDAQILANALHVKIDEISIENSYLSITGSLEQIFSGLPQDVTEENIQSRIRGLLLMAISNKTGKMLLTTGNKSEMSVGYATLYGDMAGGFAPLKDVSKTLVYELANYRNEISEVIPQRIIMRPPSAELAPDQVDQDSLPPYDILDPILEMFVELDYTIEKIVAEGFNEKIVRRVVSMVLRNEYKRRQAPPGVKITSRAYGKDRRYPITSGFLKSEK